MAHHTREQLAERRNEQKLKAHVKNKVAVFWPLAEMCQREPQAGFF